MEKTLRATNNLVSIIRSGFIFNNFFSGKSGRLADINWRKRGIEDTGGVITTLDEQKQEMAIQCPNGWQEKLTAFVERSKILYDVNESEFQEKTNALADSLVTQAL